MYTDEVVRNAAVCQPIKAAKELGPRIATFLQRLLTSLNLIYNNAGIARLSQPGMVAMMHSDATMWNVQVQGQKSEGARLTARPWRE